MDTAVARTSIEDATHLLPPVFRMTDGMSVDINEDQDERHVYTNVEELSHSTQLPPPAPDVADQPIRVLTGGWKEYRTESGRSYFFQHELGRSQWVPPRSLRTPQQVEAFLCATEDVGPPPPAALTASAVVNTIHRSDSGPYRVSMPDATILAHEAMRRVQQRLRPSTDEPPPQEADEMPPNNLPPPPSPLPQPDYAEPASLDSASYDTPTTHHSNDDDELLDARACAPLPPLPPNAQQLDPFVTRSMYSMKCGPSTASTELSMFPPSSNNGARIGPPDGVVAECRARGGPCTAHGHIRCGPLEWAESAPNGQGRRKGSEWTPNFFYLANQHLIIYKDEKSAEKHGGHYAPPLGVWDLRGAKVQQLTGKEKKRRPVFELLMASPAAASPCYVLRALTPLDTEAWFHALQYVIAWFGNPSNPADLHGALPLLPIPSAILPPSTSCASSSVTLPRKGRKISETDAASIGGGGTLFGRSRQAAGGSTRRKEAAMAANGLAATAAAPPTGNGGGVEELLPSRESILERLLFFFRRRPTVDALREKGIYKAELVFGSSLAAICAHEGGESRVPRFVTTVLDVIEQRGLDTDGLYRVSGNLSSVQRIRCHVDQDKFGPMMAEDDVHVLTGALKLFLRELSEPLIPEPWAKQLLQAIRMEGRQRLKRMDEILADLPAVNLETLKVLVQHLVRVAEHSSTNRMQAHNLAILFGPTLFNTAPAQPATTTKEKSKKASSKKSSGGGGESSSPATATTNSKLAFNMIMQGQVVELLLTEKSRLQSLA